MWKLFCVLFSMEFVIQINLGYIKLLPLCYGKNVIYNVILSWPILHRFDDVRGKKLAWFCFSNKKCTIKMFKNELVFI